MNSSLFSARFLKILFAITLIVQAGVLVIEEARILSFVPALFTIFWIWILAKSSSIRKTIYFRIMLICFALLLVGMLFKLEHLPGSSAMITYSILGMVITYVFRTIKKKNKGLLDWVKLSWVMAVSFVSWGIMEHIIPREYGIISNVLFFVMIGVFCLNLEQSLTLTAKNYYGDGDTKIQ
ncbi:MAG: hypothetical protein BGO31_18455 [Bacteroidetes bacterium 43-16]|nr:MAG: hypothetical protein BGO31_18455 [Bacteroidetes bacterium 43-16]